MFDPWKEGRWPSESDYLPLPIHNLYFEEARRHFSGVKMCFNFALMYS